MSPSDRFQSDAKHLERVAAWLYDRAEWTKNPSTDLIERSDMFIALTAHQTADTLDHLARDLREYATLYAGRIP